MADEKFERIGGKRVDQMGKCAGPLTFQSAKELGLHEGVKVAVGIIDAHAGGLGLVCFCLVCRDSIYCLFVLTVGK